MNISEIQKKKKWLEKSISNQLNEFAKQTEGIYIHSLELNKIDIRSIETESHKYQYLYKINIKVLL